MADPTIKEQLVSDHAEQYDPTVVVMRSDVETYCAAYSQSVWWAGFRALGLRMFLASVALQLIPWGIGRLMADAAIYAQLVSALLILWVGVRFFFPSLLSLNRYSRRVHDMALPPDPALSRAIVAEQWTLFLRDLTLPWRIVRG